MQLLPCHPIQPVVLRCGRKSEIVPTTAAHRATAPRKETNLTRSAQRFRDLQPPYMPRSTLIQQEHEQAMRQQRPRTRIERGEDSPRIKPSVTKVRIGTRRRARHRAIAGAGSRRCACRTGGRGVRRGAPPLSATVLATGRGESPTDDLGKLPVSRLSPLSPVNELNFTEFHFIFLFCFFKLFCARTIVQPSSLGSGLWMEDLATQTPSSRIWTGSCFILFSSFVFFFRNSFAHDDRANPFPRIWTWMEDRAIQTPSSQIWTEDLRLRERRAAIEKGGGRSEAVARW
jgi:hypothetical protein